LKECVGSGAGDPDGRRDLHDGTAAMIWGVELPRDATGDLSKARLTILDRDIPHLKWPANVHRWPSACRRGRASPTLDKRSRLA
jgi:hypothetical protein